MILGDDPREVLFQLPNWSCKTEVQVRGEPRVTASNRYENVAS